MQPTPRTFPQRRGAPGPGPMLPVPNPHGPHLSAQQVHAQEQAKRDAWRRQSRVPTDREIPDGTEEFVLGDVVQRYRALREAERKLDSVMMNKRLEVNASAQRHEKRFRTMRIWISATVPDAAKNAARPDPDSFGFEDAQAGGTYKLRIEGRILPEEGEDEDEDERDDDVVTMDLDRPSAVAQKPTKSKPYFERHKLSHLFKKITINFTSQSQASSSGAAPAPIEWKKPDLLPNGSHSTTPEANFDALEIVRPTDEPLQNITVTLHRDELFGRVRLMEPLARLLDREFDDHSGAIMGLWNYVRSQGLQEDGEPKIARCDEALKTVFQGRETLDFVYANDFLVSHYAQLPPITLPFTLRSPPPAESEPTIYDVSILTDDPLHLFTRHLRTSQLENLQQLQEFDAQLAATVQGIASSRAKVAFLNGLAADPVGFLKRWVAAQRRDEELLLGEDRYSGPEWNRGGDSSLWNSQEVREGAAVLLARNAKTMS